MKTFCYYIFIISTISFFGFDTIDNKENNNPFLNKELNEKNLKEAIKYFDLEYADIVYTQAVLESGHFKSKLCVKHNNLFGLYNSRKHEFFRFNHWSESVLGYKRSIQNRYKPPQDYYIFLKELGYAEDPNYIKKLKQLNKQYEK